MSKANDISFVTVQGDLDIVSAPSVRKTLLDLIESDIERIVIDMSSCSYIDSSGIGVLLAAIHRAYRHQCKISLIGVSERVHHTFLVAKLSEHISISIKDSSEAVVSTNALGIPLWQMSIPIATHDFSVLRERIESYLLHAPFNDEERFDLTLAIGEAIGNVIDHARVAGAFVKVTIFTDRVVADVVNEGAKVFNASTHQGPHHPEAERGRGINMMSLLTDSLHIRSDEQNCRTTVKLVKYLTSASTPQADDSDGVI